MALVVAATLTASGVRSADINFAQQIQPLLAENCFACHGPDENHREADLRLDVEDAAKEHVIVAGDAGGSEVVARITSDDPDVQMPPPDSGKSLTAEHIELLKQWIDEGAVWSGHWAYQRIEKPVVPQPEPASWSRNDIDRFVLQRIREAGLKPSPEAERTTLVRRLHLDLVGLPPTPERVTRFLNDTSDSAYEELVDELLASEHYGERMATGWLDGARYADTNGFQNDFFRIQWLWRDWVISAFNANMPYDQFVIEQMAGDLLPDARDEQLIATGFHRNNHSVTEAGSIEEEWFTENVIDRVETTSTVFLGLTMGCARCHSHKFDPITQKDFYRFYAFFGNVDEKGVYTETRGNVGAQVAVPTAENKIELAEFDTRISDIETQLAAIEAEKPRWLLDLHTRLIAHANERTNESLFQVFRAVPAGEQGTTSLFADTFQFDGDSGQVVRSEPGFQVSQPFSWSAWVNAAGKGAIFSQMDAAYRGFDTIILEDGRLKAHLIDNLQSSSVGVETEQPIDFNKWQHIAFTYDGSRKAEGVKIYVRGESVPLKIITNSLSETSTARTAEPLRLGSRVNGENLNGRIARFAIDHRALSPEQIQAARDQDLRELLKPFTAEELIAADGDSQAAIIAGYLMDVQQLNQRKSLAAAKAERAKYEKESVPTVMVMKERDGMQPAFLLKRGQYDAPDKSEELYPAVPAFLPPLPDDAPQNRLGLARWLVSRDNPLVGRVIVNRLWAKYFGHGFVDSLGNLGVQSHPPTHPELLDWLAADLMENGWDLKRLQKQIVMSATYRQSSDRPPGNSTDSGNRYLARATRFRMPAELIRDNALSVSGLLQTHVGGPSVKPYQPEGLWEELAGGANDGPYKVDGPAGLYRRSLYTYRKRTVSHPTLSTFDAPNWETCSVYRATTNTPLQSLALLNDTTYVEAGRKLAERMMLEASGDARQRITWAWNVATSREPTSRRVDVLTAAYDRYRKHFTDHPDKAKELLSNGLSQVDASLDSIDLAAYSLVASTLLNLDEVITRE